LERYSHSKRPTALTQREHYLIQTYGREWAGELGELVERWSFLRGFIEDVTVRMQDFVTFIDRIVQLAPIAHLTLNFDHNSAIPAQFAHDAALFGTDPPLSHIQTLNLPGNALGNWEVRTLCAWTSLDRLTSLDLSHNKIGDMGVRAIAAAEFFPRLVDLNLGQNPISFDGIRALEESLSIHWERGQGPRLQYLDLTGNQLSASARQELQRTRFVKRVAKVDPPESRLGSRASRMNP